MKSRHHQTQPGCHWCIQKSPRSCGRRPSERPTEEPEREDLLTLWSDILGECTQRNLTHAEDELVAFAAIAEAFHDTWGDEYLAGLWRRNLFEDLLWHRDHTSDFQEYPTLKPRPTKFRAPSWSWAAIDGYVFGP